MAVRDDGVVVAGLVDVVSFLGEVVVPVVLEVTAGFQRAGLLPPALFALDETANIAPLEALPQILATSLSAGVRFLTVWHSVAQLRRHYGQDAAAEILALCQAKVFLGSITDDFTRGYIVELLGRRQQLGEHVRGGRGVEVMTAQALQRTCTGEGLLINGDLPPVFFRQRRHYLDRGLRQLKGEPVD